MESASTSPRVRVQGTGCFQSVSTKVRCYQNKITGTKGYVCRDVGCGIVCRGREWKQTTHTSRGKRLNKHSTDTLYYAAIKDELELYALGGL